MGLKWFASFWWTAVLMIIVYVLAGFGGAAGISLLAPMFFSLYGMFITFFAIWTSVAFCLVK